VQLGEEKKPKRSSLPKGTHHSTVDLEKALSLLALPREVGLHPETNLTIVANIGRFGPYLLHDGKYANLGPEDDVLTIGMNRAVTLIAEAAEKKKNGGGRGGAPEPLKDLGAHPESGEKVVILKGRYGPYIKYAGKNITLPKDIAPEAATMESVLALLPAAGAKGGAKKKAPAKKAAAKKPAAKKAPVKKTAVKKAS
jgi:DNA topoisomerase I